MVSLSGVLYNWGGGGGIWYGGCRILGGFYRGLHRAKGLGSRGLGV